LGIRVEQISKRYDGRPAVEDVSLEIGDGQFAVLLGATGAGIDRPDTGRVFYDGEDVTNRPVRKRPVAMVYQQFVNYPSLTVYENIASPLRVMKPRPSRQALDRTVRETADLLGLAGVLEHRPEEVSGGQQQRTAIARALAKNAKYIFLDEPLGNLDYKLREELRGELKRIFRERGGAVVYATPEPVDALSIGTHAGFLHHGRLLQFGPARDVYENPATAEVGGYFSYPAMNLLPATVERDNGTAYLRVSEKLAVPTDPLADRRQHGGALVGIRAHGVHLEDVNSHRIPVPATVELSEVVGSDTELHLNHEGLRLVALLQQFRGHEIGAAVTAYVDAAGWYVFDAVSRELLGRTGG